MPAIKLKLNKENLENELNNIGVDDFTLFKHYLGHDFELGKKFKANSRGEAAPSAAIRLFNGRLYYKDFGSTEKGLNIYKFVLEQNYFPDTPKGFIQVYSLIARDFNLSCFEGVDLVSVSKNIIVKERGENPPPTIIRYRSRDWFSWEIDGLFWLKPFDIKVRDIFPWLECYRINALSHYWVNQNMFTPTKLNPTYSYSLGSKRKLYSPFSKFKWISNIDKDSIIGLNCLDDSDTLIIESSLKDCIYMRILGFNCIPCNSENTFIPEDIINKLKMKYRIIFHPNNDLPGIKAGKEFKKLYNIPYFTNPIDTPKDTTDYWLKYGRDNTKEMILNAIQCLE